ncbi:MAG: hypothetical protein ACE5IY_15385 [bacterium]
MKKEYDFSKGERGKFYHPGTEINLPVYLEPEIAEFIQKYAREKNVGTETSVNEWLPDVIAKVSTCGRNTEVVKSEKRGMEMALEYQNRKGKIFYLHVGKTKKGNPKYYFSQSQTGKLMASIPVGYEIYETPNAQVFLRKIQPTLISETERTMVEHGCETNSDVTCFKIDIKKDAIVVYVAEDKGDRLADILKTFSSVGFDESLRQELLHYEAVMKFELIDKERRLFIAKRYCFQGSIDDWICIGHIDTLEAHVRNYVRHLGKDSFYELM